MITFMMADSREFPLAGSEPTRAAVLALGTTKQEQQCDTGSDR